MAYYSYGETEEKSTSTIMWSLGKGQEMLVLLKKAVRIVTSSDHCKTLIIQSRIQTVVNLYLFYLIIHNILNNP